MLDYIVTVDSNSVVISAESTYHAIELAMAGYPKLDRTKFKAKLRWKRN